MIVGQYVLGIKVPGRSNSVIFMISGRPSSWGGEGERNTMETQGSREGKGEEKARQSSATRVKPFICIETWPSGFRLLTRECDDALWSTFFQQRWNMYLNYCVSASLLRSNHYITRERIKKYTREIHKDKKRRFHVTFAKLTSRLHRWKIMWMHEQVVSGSYFTFGLIDRSEY